MKKHELVLKENEESVVDFDDTMSNELSKFKKLIKGITKKDVVKFNNWIKIYKLLNYDIIEGLKIVKVYKFNNEAAVVELEFRGNKEYDFLNFNPETMTVACMNVKNNKARNYISRRLLIPDTVEEALTFAKSVLTQDGIKVLTETIQDLKKNGKSYDVTEQLELDKEFKIFKEETKKDNVNEQKEETKKDKVKEQKEETKKDKVKEQKGDIDYNNMSNFITALNNNDVYKTRSIVMNYLRNKRVY